MRISGMREFTGNVHFSVGSRRPHLRLKASASRLHLGHCGSPNNRLKADDFANWFGMARFGTFLPLTGQPANGEFGQNLPFG